MRKHTILFALFSGLLSFQAQADTLVTEPSKDNTLYEDTLGGLSNGVGSYLFIGRTGDDKGVDKKLRRALLSFDVSSIPPGSEISSVEVSFTIDAVPIGAIAGVASIHRLEDDWGEGTSNAPGPEGQGTTATTGDATWLHTFYDTAQWTTAGGDFNASASQTANFGVTHETLVFASSAQLIADVSTWVDQPGDNFGWIVLGDEPVLQNARRFSSREHTSPELRPRLTVEYTPAEAAIPSIPAIGKAGLFILIALTLLLAGVTRRFG